MGDLRTLDQVKGNLDLFCALHGHAIANTVYHHLLGDDRAPDAMKKAASEAENQITRTLGVLQGQGIYAAFLLLASRKGKHDQKTPPETILSNCLQQLISDMDVAHGTSGNDVLKALRDGPILSDISTLLLVKRAMEQALVYARYHAKAKAGGDNGN